MRYFPIYFLLMMNIACTDQQQPPVQKDRFVLQNGSGLRAELTSYGARLMNLWFKGINVVEGCDSVSQYKNQEAAFYGATIGRFANRIGGGKFSMFGRTYTLPVNNGSNTLHGGPEGFFSKSWEVSQQTDSSITFHYVSVAGEEGFPGKLDTYVTYSLLGDQLMIQYEAKTDSPTVINLTNHTFWNLNGEGSGTILNHRLQINADGYTPVDSSLIPTGKIDSVGGTPLDFRVAKTIGRDISLPVEQLLFGKGFDHNFVLNAEGMKQAAIVTGDKSGITMEVWTDQPGLQFYSGNFMSGKLQLRKGTDKLQTAFCLETQHFPNSPNQPAFPNTVLMPGVSYRSMTAYVFKK